jgi:hypothetical protein
VGLPAPRCAVVPLLAGSRFGSCPRFFRGLFVAWSLSADRLAFAPSPKFSGRCRCPSPVAGGAPAAVPASGRAGKEKKFRPCAIETSKF